VNRTDYLNVMFDLNAAVKQRFDQEGITIPYPQRDVHVYPTKPDASI
jgi:small conductance mechanosensitive channel